MTMPTGSSVRLLSAPFIWNALRKVAAGCGRCDENGRRTPTLSTSRFEGERVYCIADASARRFANLLATNALALQQLVSRQLTVAARHNLNCD